MKSSVSLSTPGFLDFQTLLLLLLFTVTRELGAGITQQVVDRHAMWSCMLYKAGQTNHTICTQSKVQYKLLVWISVYKFIAWF